MVRRVLLCAARRPTLDFHEYDTALHVGLSRSISVHTRMVVHFLVDHCWLVIATLLCVVND